MLFSDDFESGKAANWTTVSGTWAVCAAPTGNRYCQSDPAFLPPLAFAGDVGWADYSVQTSVRLDDDAKGRVSVLGRVQDKYHFYELRLEKDTAGVKRWWIAKNVSNLYTILASGPLDYARDTDYVLKLTLTSAVLRASVSTDGGTTYQALGSATDRQYRVGRIGLKTKSTGAAFDNVTVLSAGGTPPNTRRFGHIVLVTLENHSASEVVGSPYLPYFNELASQYAIATNFYANAHPSAPNYFAFTTGRLFNQTTPLPTGTNNVVRALNAAGRSWRAYFDEPLSSANVFPFLPEVAADAKQAANIVSITPSFIDAVNNNVLPRYALVHPRYADNGHACRGAQPCLGTTDIWLQKFIAPYIANPSFAANHDLLIITWDEGNLLDHTCSTGPTTILLTSDAQKAGAWTCGGHTVFLLIGADVKPRYASTTIYHDEALLRLMLEGLGVTKNLPGAASFAPNMNEFFR
ncbi:MAG: phosphoesterase [Acidobacteria bacterium]|nr:phosphoesterase [Acidobacteriota bacterium]